MTSELSKLAHDSIIELFDLDLTSVVPGQFFHFCNYSYQGYNFVFQGKVYIPFPIVGSRFGISGTGQPEAAFLIASNITLGLMPLIREYNDLVNCKLIRKRVFFKNLDGQSAANPNAILDESHWYLDRVEYNKLEIRWELRRLRDLGNTQIPGRVVAANLCAFRYRRWVGNGFDYSKTAECGYHGQKYFDLNDQPCDPSRDACSHSLKACELRFNGPRFGGFPGAGQINYND